MPNTKRVFIEGFMHFAAETTFNGEDFKEDERDSVAMELLGFLNLPTWGIRITYDGLEVKVPNKHAGETAFCHYVIRGTEAVATSTLQTWITALERVGVVLLVSVFDMDNESQVLAIDYGMDQQQIHRDILRAVKKAGY